MVLRRFTLWGFLLALVAVAGVGVLGEESLIPDGAGLSSEASPEVSPRSSGPRSSSPRNANYLIDVKLDPETKILDGRQVLTWRNIQSEPTDELWFHLYWNGWRNSRSTWMLESRLRQRRGPFEASA